MRNILPLILVAVGMSSTLVAQQIGPNAYIGQGATAADRAIDNQRYMAEQNARMQQEQQQRDQEQRIQQQQQQIDQLRRQQQYGQ
jgi:carbonic anhydrase/acetyltransferase-like protein (isoleucine patch superfamily)